MCTGRRPPEIIVAGSDLARLGRGRFLLSAARRFRNRRRSQHRRLWFESAPPPDHPLPSFTRSTPNGSLRPWLPRQDGGAGGIRTLDRALQPYNGLANRRLQPLGHSSVKADMPDAGASRKRQILGCRNRGRFIDGRTLIWALRRVWALKRVPLSRSRNVGSLARCGACANARRNGLRPLQDFYPDQFAGLRFASAYPAISQSLLKQI